VLAAGKSSRPDLIKGALRDRQEMLGVTCDGRGGAANERCIKPTAIGLTRHGPPISSVFAKRRRRMPPEAQR
jgi:hypothetical protein